jgi:hypothetical protein
LFVSLRRVLPALAALTLLFALTAGSASAAVESASSSGAIRFVKRTDPSFDRFMNAPTAAFSSWMRTKFWRSEVFTPYFDSKTSWYGQGWLYLDSYAVYNGSSLASQHPEWILKDTQGSKLFIPWGCGGGTCPQYAADIGNPAYRASWIANAKSAVARGYKGIWVDDVNLDLRVGNGNGQDVRPLDPRTGQPMTDVAWRTYFATFMEELRAAVPSAEIVHNSIWYAVWGQRDNDPAVKRQIAAADYINLERGVNDGGLGGGNGEWSLNALLGFVDRVHAAGKGVVFDAFDDSAQGREYNLAAYLETSNGKDGVGLQQMTPENWWSMYDADLGAACGPRVTWNGLLRRDFAGGTVLVNEPQAPTRTATLPHAMTDSSGTSVTAVTLKPSSGAVLRGSTNCTPVTPDPAPAVPTAPAPTTPPATAPAPAPTTPPATTTPKPTTTTPGNGARKKRPRIAIVKIALKGRGAPARSAKARAARTALASAGVSGQAIDATCRSVVVSFARKVGGRFQRVRRLTDKLDGTAYSVRATGLVAGQYRVTVACATASAHADFAVAA